MWPFSVTQGSTSRISSFFFQAEDGIRDKLVTGVQTCALPILSTLVDMALKLRPLRMGRHLLGQELYKAAKSATSELVVREYPSFKLRKRKPHTDRKSVV